VNLIENEDLFEFREGSQQESDNLKINEAASNQADTVNRRTGQQVPRS
jgi:hypothetical protein